MKCPKCKFENPPISDVCQNCGLKFKIKCPECSAKNKVGTERCTNCGYTLIRFCKKCKAPNSPIALECRKCSAPLLLKCPECNALNPIDSSKCLKCSYSFTNSASQYSKSIESENPALIIELSNYEELKKRINDETFFQKLLRRFYQTVLKTINDSSLKVLKIKPHILAVEFDLKKVDSKENTASAIYLANAVFDAFKDLNLMLQEKASLTFSLKELVLNESQIEEEYLIEILNSLEADSVFLDKKSFDSTAEILVDLDFEPLESGWFKLTKSQDIQTFEETVVEEVVDIVEKETNSNQFRFNREDAIKFLLEKISNQDNSLRFISLQGPEGIGKSSILNLIVNSGVGEKNLVLFSECCDLFSIKPFGLFQDLLRTLLGIPFLNINSEEIESQLNYIINEGPFAGLSQGTKNVIKDFILPISSETEDLNILSESATKKDQIYLAFEELFIAFKASFRLIIIIEDLEYADDSSIELLEYLIDNGLLNNKAILITTQTNSIPSEVIVNSSNLTRENTITIKLEPFSEEETMKCIDGFSAKQPLISLSYKEEIFKKSKGIPFYIQHLMMFFIQINAIEAIGPSQFSLSPNIYGISLPDSIEELLILRLDDLFKKYKNSYKVMCYAVKSGFIFSLDILQKAMNISEDEFKTILEMFVRNHFFFSYDGKMYFFKNKLIMNAVKKNLIKEGYEEEINFDLLQASKQILRGDDFYCAALAQGANQNQESFALYSKASKQALFSGDINLYLKAQKYLLKLFDYSPFSDKEERKKLLCEELGKANYLTCPQDAVEFLSEALQLISGSELSIQKEYKIMDILGYLAKSFVLCGNFQGALQAIEQSLGYINSEKSPLEYALLASLKMKVLMYLGSVGELSDLAVNKVFPVFNDAVERKITISKMNLSELRSSRQDAILTLARAFAIQGNENCKKLIESADVDNSMINKNYIDAMLTDALLKSLQGDIRASQNSLDEADKASDSIGVSSDINLLWTFITLLNNYFEGNFENMESKILALSQKSKKANNSLIYNFSTLLMAGYFREIKQFDKAKAIINDRVNYFSQQKISTGALWCWYLIGCIFLEEKNIEDALSVAKQALEVAQKPSINNIYFSILFEKLIADCYIASNDFEMVNIHVERAIKQAKANNMVLLQCKLYALMARAYEEITINMPDSKSENAQNAYELYKIASDIALSLENEFMQKKIKLDIATLKAYCNLNKISLKESQKPQTQS